MIKKVSNWIATVLILLFANRTILCAGEPPAGNRNVHHVVKRQTNATQSSNDDSGTDFLLIIFFVGCVSLLYYFKIYLPKKRRTDFLNFIDEIIEKNEKDLFIVRSKMVTLGSFGKVYDDNWKKKGIPEFIEMKIKGKLTKRRDLNTFNDEEIQAEIIEKIDTAAQNISILGSSELVYDPLFSGTEYEKFCALILSSNGWSTQLMGGSKDKGADIIAAKNNIKVLVQCKHYTDNAVGILAVQATCASQKYYDTHYGVVVNNKASYTKDAITFAKGTDVRLLHHNDLHKDDFYI